MKPMVKIALLSLPLVACGGGSNSGQHNIQKEPPVNTDYSALSESQLEPGPLRQASASELSELVKNGLRVSLSQNQSYGMMVRETAVTNNTADNKSGGDFSGTNVQVANVDEADGVKYDGNYIYLATDPLNASVSEVSNTPLDTEHWGSVSEMYLVDSANGCMIPAST